MEIKDLWNRCGRNDTERRKGGNHILESLIENADQLQFTDSEYDGGEWGIRIQNGLFYKSKKDPPTLQLIIEDIYKKKEGEVADLVDMKTRLRSGMQAISGTQLIAEMMQQMGGHAEMDSRSALSVIPTKHGLRKTKLEFSSIGKHSRHCTYMVYSVQQVKETGGSTKQNTFIMSILTLQFQFLDRYLGILLL
jgi:hypothetical protein